MLAGGKPSVPESCRAQFSIDRRDSAWLKFPWIWRPGRRRSRAARATAVSLLTAAVAGASLSPAAGAVSRPEHSAAAMAGELHGVWCAGASDCVAVGDHFSEAHGLGEALIERWNGSTWSVVPSPSPIHFPHSGAELDGVTCVSANDCLATFTFLRGVACTSGRNCWAAGEWGSPTGPRTLIEHWNGSAWSITG